MVDEANPATCSVYSGETFAASNGKGFEMKGLLEVSVKVYVVLTDAKKVIRATDNQEEAEIYRHTYETYYPQRRTAEVVERLITL